MFQFLTNINVDWMGIRKPLIAISILVLLAGLISAVGRQFTPGGTDAFNLGVDFQGGTVVTAKFRQKPSTDEIRSALQGAGVGEATIQDSTDKQDEVLIKVPNLGQREECKDERGEAVPEAGRCIVKKALDGFGKEAEGPTQLNQDESAAYKIVGTDAVGPHCHVVRSGRHPSIHRVPIRLDIRGRSCHRCIP
jgi:preprotein translocase subunit SecF